MLTLIFSDYLCRVSVFKTMKKIKKTVITLLLAIMSGIAVAQTVTSQFDFGYADYAALSIPKEFSYNEVPHLVMYDKNDRNTLQIYNERLEVVKTITMKEDIPFTYQLTYQDEIREVIAVNEVVKIPYCQFESLEAFVQQQKMIDPDFDESCITITSLTDGTKRITIDYTNSKYSSNEQMYFAYTYFGMRYPMVYYIENEENLVGYQVRYSIEYSDWKSTGTRTVDCNESQKRIRLCNINLNLGDGKTNWYFEISQTLFNKDEQFEYIVPKYRLSSNGNIGTIENSYPDDGQIKVVTTRTTVVSEQKELALAGFIILSEDGNVISDIDFDSGFEGNIYTDHAFVITIGKSVYLAFDGYCNNEYSTIFYKIDNSTNSIQKVMTAPSTMVLSPTIASSGTPINVKFGDSNENGSDIMVVSATGALLKSYHVPAGQTSLQIYTNSPAGMYGVCRLQKNKSVETKKIIIK